MDPNGTVLPLNRKNDAPPASIAKPRACYTRRPRSVFMTDRYAVIGNPIGHSKSPFIHAAFARETSQDLTYEAIEAPPGGFAEAADAFRSDGGRGLNVTLPFKLDACAYATDLTQSAELAGAANALKFDGDRVYAENFDGLGLVKDIERNLGFRLAGKRVLILGAGGAARGAVAPLLKSDVAAIAVANRTFPRAIEVAKQFRMYGEVIAADLRELGGQEPFDLVINATSASLSGALPEVPAGCFGARSLAYEMLYGKGLTPFLRLAKSAGSARVADGVGMLVEQAAEAFAWWRGVRPETAPVIAAMTVPLT
jgi:shikimate dehydrogenase